MIKKYKGGEGMKEGDSIRIKLDVGLYEYGEVADVSFDPLGYIHLVTYIDKFGNEKQMNIEFVELVK
jgi:hypothetical protein